MNNFVLGLFVGMFFAPVLARLVADWSKVIFYRKLEKQLHALESITTEELTRIARTRGIKQFVGDMFNEQKARLN